MGFFTKREPMTWTQVEPGLLQLDNTNVTIKYEMNHNSVQTHYSETAGRYKEMNIRTPFVIYLGDKKFYAYSDLGRAQNEAERSWRTEFQPMGYTA